MTSDNELHRLISLTFDEDANVRKKAAESLSKSDDPAAVFALVELSYDKDESVQKFVKELLEKRHPNNGNGNAKVMSFADIFGPNSFGNSTGTVDKSKDENKLKQTKKHKTKREKLMEPIVKLFEKTLGKEKAKIVSKKLMPSIEKIYDKATKSSDKDKNEEHRRMMQVVLTQYLTIVKDVGSIEPVNVPRKQQELLQETILESEKKIKQDSEGKSSKSHQESSTRKEETDNEETNRENEKENREENEKENEENDGNILDEIGDVVGGIDVGVLEKDIKALSELDGTLQNVGDREKQYTYKTLFGKIYEIMLATDGDEKIMKKEQERMITAMKRDIELAFKVARNKFRAKNITFLPDLKDGMRNVYTDVLTVKDLSTFEYGKRKKKQGMSVTVSDADGNEGLIYLFDDRGSELKVGMRIKVEKGYVRTFEFSNQTALTVSKAGSVYIIV